MAGLALASLTSLDRCVNLAKDFEVVISSYVHGATRRAEELRTTIAMRGTLNSCLGSSRTDTNPGSCRERVDLVVGSANAIITAAVKVMAVNPSRSTRTPSAAMRGANLAGGRLSDLAGGWGDHRDSPEQSLTDDGLVNRADALNWRVVGTRMDQCPIQGRIPDF